MRCDRGNDVSSSHLSSLKKKIRCSAFFSCCFGGVGGAPEDVRPASLLRSSSTWRRSKVKQLTELRKRYRILLSRTGRPSRRAGVFRYDPLSYALNFDDGDDNGEDSDAFRYRKSAVRLPGLPTPVAVTR